MHKVTRVAGIGALAGAIVLSGVSVAEAQRRRFESGRRAALRQAPPLVEMLRLEAGMVVADVGAGRGEWAVVFAEHVGPSGHVFATDIDPGRIDDIAHHAESIGVDNVTPTLGTATDTGLPAGCCDVMLLRLSYHEFTEPEPMLEGLLQALKPGGTVAVIEYSGDNLHEIDAEQVLEEFSAAGFRFVRRITDWNISDQYCLLFTR